MASKFIIPRPIRLLTKFGAEALKPSLVNGKYNGPMIPPRIAANVRKRAVIEGTYGSFIPHIGGWDPTWDKPRNIYLTRPLKGHAIERNREKRAQKIDVAMKGMPDRIKKFEQEANDRKPKKDIIFQFKRIADIAKAGGRRRRKK